MTPGESSEAFEKDLLRLLRYLPPGPEAGRARRLGGGMVTLMLLEGMAGEVARLLSPFPDAAPLFEVWIGEQEPEVVATGPDAEQALRRAEAEAAAGQSVDVISLAGGVARRALHHPAGGSGVLELLPPASDHLDGPAEACQSAKDAWSPAPAPAPPAPVQGVAAALAGGAVDLDIELDPAAVKEAVTEALAEVALEFDAAAIEDAVRSAVREVLEGAPAALEDTISRAVEASRTDPDELRRVVEGALAARPTPEPTPALDAEQLAARLAETLSQDAAAGATRAAVESLAASLRQELDFFEDRVRAGGRSIEALADELAARDRSAADLTGQLVRATEAALARVAERLDRLAGRLDGTH